MIKTIKQIHPKDIALVKVGEFYHAYGKDSYILSYLMGYKLKVIDNNCSMCGFPQKSLPKIRALLDHQKINYILLDQRNNYDVDEKADNKNLNTYDEIFAKAHRYINLKRRIDDIYESLIQNINDTKIKEKISEIEEIVEK